MKPDVLDIQTETAPVEVCDARPHAAATSSNADPEVSADILLMEQTVGQYIRDAGNPQERDLYDMLKKLKHQYTRKQIRMWKQHYGQRAAVCAETAPAKSSHQSAAAVCVQPAEMIDGTEVPADIRGARANGYPCPAKHRDRLRRRVIRRISRRRRDGARGWPVYSGCRKSAGA